MQVKAVDSNTKVSIFFDLEHQPCSPTLKQSSGKLALQPAGDRDSDNPSPQHEGAEWRLPEDWINTVGITYDGEWVGEQRHGKGTMVIPKKGTYVGQWSANQFDGEGTFTHEDGTSYVGQWKAGQPCNEGMFLQKNGMYYAGQWLDDTNHGKGAENDPQLQDPAYPDGARYEGEYRYGKKHGKGKFFWPNGAWYEGEFHHDRVHGEGTNRMANGRQYTGQWSANKMHGEGVFSFDDGRRYEGQYIKGEKEGVGTFRWADGRVYEGGFKAGKQHGRGVLRTPDQPEQRGTWEDGVFTADVQEMPPTPASPSSIGEHVRSVVGGLLLSPKSAGGGGGMLGGFASPKSGQGGGMLPERSEESMAEARSPTHARGSGWRRPSPTVSSSNEGEEEEEPDYARPRSTPKATAMRPSDVIL